MQVRVKEAKSMLSCYLSIQVSYMFCVKNLPWALRFRYPVSSSHLSFFFAKEEILAESRHALKLNYSAVLYLTNVADHTYQNLN